LVRRAKNQRAAPAAGTRECEGGFGRDCVPGNVMIPIGRDRLFFKKIYTATFFDCKFYGKT
jgi:hypothetical protein